MASALSIITGLIGNAVGYFTDKLEHKRKIQEAEVTSKLRINEAITTSNIDSAERGQIADINWSTTMAEASASSWKDEWCLLLLSIPTIMSFVPSWAPYVELGFHALSTAPEWYKACFIAAVSASFGLNLYKRVKM